MSDNIIDWRTLNLQSLDIILCEGKSKLSKRIQIFQRLTGASKVEAKISHIAAVFYLYSKDSIAVQESTTLNKWANQAGVQMNFFNDWLKNYDGKVYVRQLNFQRTLTFTNDDYGFWLEHRNDKYEHGIAGALELFLCGLMLHKLIKKIPGFKNYKPFYTKDPHCSELVAKRMAKHELWNRPIVINRMPPWIWWSEIDKWLNPTISDPLRIK